MNWHIGQRIVAVFSTDEWTKGDEFTIDGIKKKGCCDRSILLTIGRHGINTECGKCCGSLGGMWFNERCFAPIQSRPELSELTDEMILTAPTTKELQTA